jgi:hypothetical protein
MRKLKQVIQLIKKISKENDIHPSMVKQNQLINYGFTAYELSKLGGLALIKKRNFPVKDKDLKVIHEAKKGSSYITKLEKALAEKTINDDLVMEVIKKTVTPVVKIKSPKFAKHKDESVEVVAMLNDNHIGLVVDSEEVGGANSFDFKEAGRRIAYYVQEVCGYKKHKRNQVKKLHLILAGDNLAGLIHGLDTKSVHLMIHQMNAMLHIYTHAISLLASEYPQIEVHGIPGNHGRSVHKNGGGRAVAETYDSYENILFYSLSAAFRNNKQISFNVPKTPYANINLPAGRCLVAHGDHIFSKYLGNPGSSINVKSLSGAIKDFNAGEMAKGAQPVKLLLFGHVHSFAHFITNDGVEVYISPSLVGLDQYAHSLTINNNFIAQPVFESTPKFILGDSRLIRLNSADSDNALDKLIPIYNKELKWSK